MDGSSRADSGLRRRRPRGAGAIVPATSHPTRPSTRAPCVGSAAPRSCQQSARRHRDTGRHSRCRSPGAPVRGAGESRARTPHAGAHASRAPAHDRARTHGSSPPGAPEGSCRRRSGPSRAPPPSRVAKACCPPARCSCTSTRRETTHPAIAPRRAAGAALRRGHASSRRASRHPFPNHNVTLDAFPWPDVQQPRRHGNWWYGTQFCA